MYTLPYLTELWVKTRKQIYWYTLINITLLSLLRTKKERMVIQCGGVKDILLQATEYNFSNTTSFKVEIVDIFMGLQYKIAPINQQELNNQNILIVS